MVDAFTLFVTGAVVAAFAGGNAVRWVYEGDHDLVLFGWVALTVAGVALACAGVMLR